MSKISFYFSFLILFIVSCSEPTKKTEKELAVEKFGKSNLIEHKTSPNPDRNAYFGDLHVHTENSFDAYSFGTTASPADAYKYARGEAIKHPTGYLIQLSRPLDFYAVTDHGIFLGLMKEASNPASEIGQYEITKPLPVSYTHLTLPTRNCG